MLSETWHKLFQEFGLHYPSAIRVRNRFLTPPGLLVNLRAWDDRSAPPRAA
jgi:hypothetical protein